MVKPFSGKAKSLAGKIGVQNAKNYRTGKCGGKLWLSRLTVVVNSDSENA